MTKREQNIINQITVCENCGNISMFPINDCCDEVNYKPLKDFVIDSGLKIAAMKNKINRAKMVAGEVDRILNL